MDIGAQNPILTTAATPPTSVKGLKTWHIILIVVAVLSVGGVILYFVFKKPEKAEKTTRNNKDIEDAEEIEDEPFYNGEIENEESEEKPQRHIILPQKPIIEK
jgi:beta-lactam-binding protein with PASTA domain